MIIPIHNIWSAICETHETREEWIDARRTGIGASESPGIFGVGYEQQSPITIWSSKIGGPEVEFDAAALKRMNRGKKMEPIIADEFADEVGFPVVDPGEFTVYRSAEHPWLFATLDRFCIHPEFGPIPVEIKNVNGRFRGDWDEEEEPPLKYVVQCQHQMAVTGTSHCYLVGLVGGDELVIRLLERNQRFIDAMVIKLREFWGYVERREMPPVDESEATRAMLGLIYPHDTGDEVSLPPDATEWDHELTDVKEKIKSLDSRKTLLENQLRAAIGNASVGRLPFGGGYSWKQQTRSGIDAKMLRDRYPEAATVCATETSFRVLRRSSK